LLPQVKSDSLAASGGEELRRLYEVGVRNTYEEIRELVAARETVAAATVISAQGSTPRQVGAKMVVRSSGDIVGTIGGGCGEAEVWQAAMYSIQDGERRIVEVDLTEDVTLETEMVCGGVMKLFIDVWTEEDADLAEAITAALEEKKRLVLATVISSDRPSWRRLVLPDGKVVGSLGDDRLDGWVTSEATKALEEGASRTVADRETGLQVFLDVQMSPPTLLIAGGGHIAVPVARLGTMLGFRVVVLDDRPHFANRERFPGADEVLAADFGETLSSYPIDDQTYIAIMTRGHTHDMECLLQVIGSPAAYIGMIGSRRRVKGVFELLKEQGCSEEATARIHAPIGLDIGAETPEEIALSVMGEIVKARRGGSGSSLSRA
jgi:xanthine dehydrogenase accessory factor